MKIAIIGAGNVGGTLGQRFAQLGHRVVFGVKDSGDPKLADLLRSCGPNASAASVGGAADRCETIVLAVPWQAVTDALQAAGNLSGKLLLDCTNPLKADLSGLEIGLTSSAGEKVAELAPGARVVKIFNTTGYNNMANPRYGSNGATMFYCGDDAAAKSEAAELATQLGFEPIDAGPLAHARLLEPAAMLWIWLAIFGGQGPNVAFHLDKR